MGGRVSASDNQSQETQTGETPMVETLVPNLHCLVLAIRQSPYLDQIRHWRKFKINQADGQSGNSGKSGDTHA